MFFFGCFTVPLARPLVFVNTSECTGCTFDGHDELLRGEKFEAAFHDVYFGLTPKEF